MRTDVSSSLPPTWTLYTPKQRWGLLAILFVVSTSNYADRQVIAVLIEPIKAEFGVSDAMLGLLSGFAFALLYAVLGLPVAWLADRSNRKRIISASLFLWSLMTVVCGLAQSFGQLLLARAGVGIGEAGAIPPAQSLIADYFPPAQRTRAFAIFTAAGMVGFIIAYMLGAHIAAQFGWRAALIALGVPGILLGVVTMLGLSEPRELPAYASQAKAGETLSNMFQALWSKRSYGLLVLAMILNFLLTYGATVTWIPPYLMRVLHVPLEDVGTTYGVVQAVAMLTGAFVGGMLTDVLAQRDERWLVRLPALLMLLCFPTFELAMLAPDFETFLPLIFVAAFLHNAALPAIWATLHRVCGSPRRAMAVALVFFFANLIGLGTGPLVTGALSDTLSAQYGPVGLGYAVMAVLILFVPCAALLYRASTHLQRDAEG